MKSQGISFQTKSGHPESVQLCLVRLGPVRLGLFIGLDKQNF